MRVFDLIIALKKVSPLMEVFLQDEDFEMGTIHISPLKGTFVTELNVYRTPTMILAGDPNNRSIID